jgi:hypothetical protein
MSAKTGRRWTALALLLAAVCGCSNGLNLVSVSGRVTYQGKPVPSTLVTFHADDGSRGAKGVTDDEGNFKLRYSRQQSGIVPGSYTVVLSYVTSNEEETGVAPPKASKELREIISRYADPKKSKLHYEVTSSGQFIEVRLE